MRERCTPLFVFMAISVLACSNSPVPRDAPGDTPGRGSPTGISSTDDSPEDESRSSQTEERGVAGGDTTSAPERELDGGGAVLEAEDEDLWTRTTGGLWAGPPAGWDVWANGSITTRARYVFSGASKITVVASGTSAGGCGP